MPIRNRDLDARAAAERSGPLTAADRRRLAVLHVESLPFTAIGCLGEGYAERFYRYVERSGGERVFVHREAGRIDAAAVLSLDPDSLARRLWVRTPLALFVLALFPGPQMRRVARALPPLARPARAERGGAGAPEVIALFTALDRRRHGIASALLARTERFLLHSGYDRYVVRTPGAGPNPARPFYIRNGFTPRAGPMEGIQIWEKRVARSMVGQS